MTFAQPWPWWALLVAAASVAALAWRAGWWAGAQAATPPTAAQRLVLVGLRVATLLVLLAILMRPVLLLPDPSAQGSLVVLVDASRSMGLADVQGRSRLESAQAVVRDYVAPAVNGRLALQVLAFGEDVRTVAPEELGRIGASARITDVARALEAVRRRAAAQPIAGVLMVSDGGFVLGDDAAPGAVSAPLYALGVGASTVARDREVRVLTAGEASVAGSTIDVTATVVSVGFGDEPLEVRLSANGRPIESRKTPAAGEGVPTEIVFRVAPDATAATLYTVEVVPRDGELTTDNNRRSLLATPPGRTRRVLLLEGAPGWEHSFLKRALDQDDALALDAVIRKGPNDAGEQTFYVQAAESRGAALRSGFPNSRQNLFAYDAVVLANVETDALTRDQLAVLSEFVAERGGGLIVLGGRSLDPAAVAGTVLEELLPLEISDRRTSGVARADFAANLTGGVGLTPDGERHPVMRLGATVEETRNRWAKLPALPSVASVGNARPGATVLALTSGPGGIARPLVAVQRYGRGRVLAFAGEAAWRWRMLLPSTDTTYPTFWRQAARWVASAAPEPVSVRTRSLGPGRLEVTVDARDDAFRPSREADVQVDAVGSDGVTHSARAGWSPAGDATYRADIRVPDGVTRVDVRASAGGVQLGRATTWALTGADDDEMIEPRRNDAQLARLAQRFGGRLVAQQEIGAVVDEITARRAASAALIERDVWHTPWLLLLLVAMLVGEWALRRRWGLR